MLDKVNILVVDDEAVVRQSFERILGGDRCEVVSVADGIQALQAMEEQCFDLALVDLRMPGMDGMELLRQIKLRSPQTEVVIVTGYPALDTAKASVGLGAFDYLAKPVGPQDVIQVANRALLQKGWALRRPPCSRAQASARLV